jgi:hypothetical protein
MIILSHALRLRARHSSRNRCRPSTESGCSFANVDAPSPETLLDDVERFRKHLPALAG